MDRLGAVAGISALFAVVAACGTTGAWLVPRIRADESRFTVLMVAAMAVWVVAEVILFAGGLAVR